MVDQILEAELTDHLGYEEHASDGRNRGNSRNGKTTKTLNDDRGDLPVEIPQDREGSFDPKLIREYRTRWPDFDEGWSYRPSTKLLNRCVYFELLIPNFSGHPTILKVTIYLSDQY